LTFARNINHENIFSCETSRILTFSPQTIKILKSE
jgi:hypothetical protein